MKPRVLIAYYSMQGHTRQLAHELAKELSADLEEIREPKPRHGVTGVMRAMWDTLTNRSVPLSHPAHRVTDYDLLILGGPIWMGHAAAPVRSFARRYATGAQKVSFFFSAGSNKGKHAMNDLQFDCKQSPAATLLIDHEHLPRPKHEAMMAPYIRALRVEPPTGSSQSSGTG